MAFDVTSQSPTRVENVGINHSLQMHAGVVALSGGSATVTIPGVDTVVFADASSQTANAARVSATSGQSFTITGTGSDIVMWMALCRGKM